MGKIKRDGYTFHSFLQSDGNAYIDSGYKPTTIDNSVEVTFSSDVAPNYLFGSMATSMFALFYSRSRNVWGAVNSASLYAQYTNLPYNLGSISTVKLVNNASEAYIEADGNRFNLSKRTAVLGSTIKLFCNDYQGVAQSFSSIKAYSFIIKDSGVIVSNLIPASRDSDGVCGMYDLITDTFLTNANTVGEFTVGEEKDYYEWVEIKEIKRLITPSNDTFHINQGSGTFLKGADVKFETIRTINRVINGELKTIKL